MSPASWLHGFVRINNKREQGGAPQRAIRAFDDGTVTRVRPVTAIDGRTSSDESVRLWRLSSISKHQTTKPSSARGGRAGSSSARGVPSGSHVSSALESRIRAPVQFEFRSRVTRTKHPTPGSARAGGSIAATVAAGLVAEAERWGGVITVSRALSEKEMRGGRLAQPPVSIRTKMVSIVNACARSPCETRDLRLKPRGFSQRSSAASHRSSRMETCCRVQRGGDAGLGAGSVRGQPVHDSQLKRRTTRRVVRRRSVN
jgi:hypothetical protein